MLRSCVLLTAVACATSPTPTPEEPAPVAVFIPQEGPPEDWSAALLGSEPVVCTRPGTLELSPGIYPPRLVVEADLAVVGLGTLGDVQLLARPPASGSRVTVARTASLSLISLRVTGGIAERGGAIHAPDGAPGTELLVTDAILDSNFAHDQGGAVWTSGRAVTLERVEVRDNWTDGAGGGLYIRDAPTVSIRSSTLEHNRADGDGGGMRVFGGGLEIADSTISNNRSGDRGGGLSVEADGSAVLTGVGLVGNETAGRGGGLWVDDGAVAVLQDCTVSDNRADTGGGVFVKDRASAMVRRSAVVRNAAQAVGGAFVWELGSYLTSEQSDWGSGGNDNLPVDTGMSCGEEGDWGADASFEMDGTECVCT